MNKQLVKELAEQLRSRRSSLLFDGSNLEIVPEKVEERESELEESAQLDRMTGIKSRLEDRDHRNLQAIEIALDRLAEGKYGVCQQCGDKIGPARLRALPTATLCIDCATERERKNKIPGIENAKLLSSRIDFDLHEEA